MEDLIDFLGYSPQVNLKRENMPSEEKKTETKVQEDPQTGDTEGMSRIEAEVEGLKETCRELIRINRDLRERAEAPLATIKPLLKPRDIPILELNQLKGIEGGGKLTVFLAQVENCAIGIEERQRIVTTRVDANLALYVQTLIRKNQYVSWEKFKTDLLEELTDQNKDNLFDALGEMKYMVEQCPTEFVAEVKCRFATLETRAKRDEMPDINKVIKSKLMQALPRLNRERLEMFRDAHVSLKRFLDRYHLERTVVLAQGGHVRQVREETKPPDQFPARNEASTVVGRLDALEKKLDAMGTRRPFYRETSTLYCPYCNMRNHTPSNCRKKPKPGSCFDCLRLNCRRGDPKCTGRVNQTR